MEGPHNMAVYNTRTWNRKPVDHHTILLWPNLSHILCVQRAESCSDLNSNQWTSAHHLRRHSWFLGRAAVLKRARPRSHSPRMINHLINKQLPSYSTNVSGQRPLDRNLFQRPERNGEWILMHGHAFAQTQAQQATSGQAVGFMTTGGLLLLVPPQQVFFDTCPSCGNRQPTGGKYCSQCGTRLHCPSCGTLSWGKNYCHECGQSLKP